MLGYFNQSQEAGGALSPYGRTLAVFLVVPHTCVATAHLPGVRISRVLTVLFGSQLMQDGILQPPSTTPLRAGTAVHVFLVMFFLP